MDIYFQKQMKLKTDSYTDDVKYWQKYHFYNSKDKR